MSVSEKTDSLVSRDANVIWHPYTQHKTSKDPLPIIKGEGVYLIDEKGNKYIDAISSWWTNLHGHAHPYIAEKIYEQAKQLEHVIFAGCTHEAAVRLGERILELLPENFTRIFYSDNGSTAVEVAMKMAIQFWGNQEFGIRNSELGTLPNSKLPITNSLTRTKILALRHSYHGDTFGAMSVSDRGIFTLAFEKYLFEVIFIDTPTIENISTIKSQIENLSAGYSGKSQVAAFIYEPLVQGAGGMRMYDPTLMNELLHAIKLNDIICIADEVMTGFGRTGKLFASDYMNEKPDIICLSKGLTGGALPLAITACSEKIYNAFLSDDSHKTFFHGHSYTANPLACAAALASLDLLQKENCQENIQYISQQHQQFVEKLLAKSCGQTSNPRCLGAILAFEIDTPDNNYLSQIKEKITGTSLQRGILLRPLGNTVYIMPPYCISPVQLQKIYAAIDEILLSI